MVKMAKVLALSNNTSLMGKGLANYAFDAVITVLKY